MRMAKDEELRDEDEQEPEEAPEDEEEAQEREEKAREEKEARAKPRAARRAVTRAARKERKRRKKRPERRPRGVMREQIAEGLPFHATMAPAGALVGAGLALAGGIFWFITRTFKWPVIALLAVGGALLIAALVVRFGDVVAYVRRRGTLSTANTAIAVLLVLGIMVIGNYVAMRYTNVKWDATEEKLFSLSQQTRKTVQGLNKKVEIGGFYQRGGMMSQAGLARETFQQYDELSAKLTAAVYDPRLDQKAVQEWGITSPNITIVRAGDRRKEVYSLNEQNLTNAILEVTTDKKPKLYFLQGHGEKTIEFAENERDSYSNAKGKLEAQQYQVETLNLATSGEEPKVPEDCDVLLLLGPKYELDPREIDAINDYLETFSVQRKQAGRALIALAPPDAPDLHEILDDWGVSVGDGQVVDFTNFYWTDLSIPLLQVGEQHHITREIGSFRSVNTFMSLPRPLQVEEQPEQYPPDYPGAPPPPPKRAVAVMKTHKTSWAETDMPITMASRADDTEDSGPVPVLVAVDAKKGEEPPPPMPGQPPPDTAQNTRLAVVGSADLANNQFVRAAGNETLFLASVAWLAERAQLISVPPKEPQQRNLTLSSGQTRFIKILTMGVMPLVIAFVGFLVWFRRR